MELVEIRELEGPNLFLLEPAVKIEVHVPDYHGTPEGPHPFSPISRAPAEVEALAETIRAVLLLAGRPDVPVVIFSMEVSGNLSLVFPWDDRRVARVLERMVRDLVAGASIDSTAVQTEFDALRSTPPSEADRPAMIPDSRRRARTIAVTGTNGKTTTTRLLAHIFRTAGYSVGWSSSSGVYIDGVEVLAGDYSGPKGAERVLTDPDVDVAVVETARGGILLRGVAAQSVDVSVFTNISPDHLDLQGIRTVEGLAWAKGVITRITKEDGYAVLNAADPLVMWATQEIDAPKFLVSLDPSNREFVEHGSGGGLAMSVVDGDVTLFETGIPTKLLGIAEIPITAGGAAMFMVENALFAAAAALAAGATIVDVCEGLRTFANTPEMNPGRLNIFERNGTKVIVDFAHNEAGLEALLRFGRSMCSEKGRLIAIIGSAGDRTDASLTELGRLATVLSDYVIAKNTNRYLRGRESDELMNLYLTGIHNGRPVPYETSDNELTAVRRALEIAGPHDVVAVMAHEYVPEISELLIAP